MNIIDIEYNICKNLEQMYKINPKILRTPTVNGNILLLEPEEGLYFELNETSVIIYQSIVDGLTKVDIRQQYYTDIKKPVLLTQAFNYQ